MVVEWYEYLCMGTRVAGMRGS